MNPRQISQTAAFIAIKFYGLTLSDPFRSWFEPGVIRFYEQIVRALPAPLNAYHRLLKREWIRSIFTVSEEVLLPGDLLHIMVRKYGIGEAVKRALSDNFEQIIIPGAGLDHLGATYSQQGIRCFELDMPRMVVFKRHFLKKYGYENSLLAIENLQIGRTSLDQVMRRDGGPDPESNTVIVAEGFFDYLSPAEVIETIAGLHSYFRGNIRIITTLFALDELPLFRQWIFKSSVRIVGEKIRLRLSKKDFKELFEQNGFPINSTVQPSVLLKMMPGNVNPGLNMLDGFYLVQTHDVKKK